MLLTQIAEISFGILRDAEETARSCRQSQGLVAPLGDILKGMTPEALALELPTYDTLARELRKLRADPHKEQLEDPCSRQYSHTLSLDSQTAAVLSPPCTPRPQLYERPRPMRPRSH